MRRKVIPIIFILAIAIAFMGCSWLGSLQIPKTPHGIYYLNAKWFNKSLERSMDQVESGDMDKAFFVEKLKPKYETGALILDMWKLALDEQGPTEEWESDFLAIKDQIITLLGEIGGVE